jgi:redox-sensing transcriptional repressor
MKPQRQPTSKTTRIPEHTVSRLSIYFRCLRSLEEEKIETISSEQLARKFGLNAAQIRKDLAYFGEFGVRGVGYDVYALREQIQKILGLTQPWPVAMIGLGNLGQALLRYKGFELSGFRIAAVFEKDRRKLPREPVGGTRFHPIEDVEDVLRATGIRMAILAVPAEEAQSVTDRLVAANIDAILNFAPVSLLVPTSVKVRTVDLTIALENLAFFLTHRDEEALPPSEDRVGGR